MLRTINILAPYQDSMKCIEEYDSKCKNCFYWLNEVLEQARKTLSLPEQYLLPKTPGQNRKRPRCALPAISENREIEEPPTLKKPCAINNVQVSSMEHSVASDTSNCPTIRYSKRISSQEASESENIYPKTRQKRLEFNKDQDDTSLKTISLQTTTESSAFATETDNTEVTQCESKKGNAGNNRVPKPPVLTKISYKTRSKKPQSETTTKTNEITEKKGATKRTKIEDSSKTPIKTAGNNVLAKTPSVKHRVKAYEENIKFSNTPKISQYSNTNSVGSTKKKLNQDDIKCTKIITHDRYALPSQQDTCRNPQSILTKALSRLSETHRRTSVIHYRLMACKIKAKRSSTVQKRKSKSSVSSDNSATADQAKSSKAMTSNSTRKSDQNLTPIVVLEKMESSYVEEKVTDKASKDDENYSDISTPNNSVPVTPLTAPANKIRKLEVSSLPKIGRTFTPCVSATSTGKLHQNYISRISKAPRTPQQGLSYLSQSSVISRVLSLREHMAPKEREKHLHEEIKKKQKREEDVLRKKDSLLKAKIEEQKRKREARMRKVSETRNRLLQEKDHKRFLEMTKEDRAAKKGAELKEKKLQILQKKQMTRKQKLAEVEERRKKEECRLQKIKEQKEKEELEKQKLQLTKEKQKIMQMHTPVTQTSIQKKAMYNSYLSKATKDKDTLINSEEKENDPQNAGPILNTTYEKKEESCESYEMTPARKKGPSPSDSTDNYGINEIKSDDETDDESAPKKKVPAWAQGMLLRTTLLQQACNPPDVNVIFGNIDPPDLTKIFAIQRKRFQKRTSSAIWHTRSFLTP